MITENIQWQNLLISFTIYGGLLFALFRLFRSIMPLVFRQKQTKTFLLKALPILELGCWLLFLSWFSFLFATGGQLFGYVIAGLLALIVFWLAWFYLRDLVAGIVFNAQQKFSLGDTIQTSDLEGRIIRFGITDMQITLTDGKISYIPYSWLLNQGVYHKMKGSVKSYSMNMMLENDSYQEFYELEQAIRSFCIALPWVNFTVPVKVFLKDKTDRAMHIEINLYLFDIKYQGLVEEAVANQFGVPKKK